MTSHHLANMTIEAAYREKTRSSARLAAEARQHFPSGVTHDSRHMTPYGLYVERAEGAHKWDVDGNRYVDFYGGHGALLLGHDHPKVTNAARQALAGGTHFAAGHAHEIAWAKAIKALLPSAERIRFTSSGTEATLIAVRLARAFTGKSKIVRFKGHFHGWHDQMTAGYLGHFDGSPTAGVTPETAAQSILIDPHDISAVRDCLAADHDIAALVVEPTGGSFGMLPLAPPDLVSLRELTKAHDVPLIFDEVITGFRVSPGGAQGQFGITPELTALAKILAGGLPGGAVAGRKDMLDRLDFEAATTDGFEKIHHPGTFNANPVSAAAGVAALDEIATTDACKRANGSAQQLRQGMNEVLDGEDVPWAAYGSFSGIHIFTNPERRAIKPLYFDPSNIPWTELKSNQPNIVHRLRVAMLLGGVDINSWPGAFVSAVLSQDDIDQTISAFRDAIHWLRREGDL
ncbi:MAG: aminotransferase class III-fold pyridoxal phosphate-dependent enzyme [Alphaproteobacteria bacterium]|nr:aminotransferase class III-fold pyridoxal phosphate-dependent enzyme [Alphaproteobacteria bacterium]